MPFSSLIVNGKSLIDLKKSLKFLLPVTCYLLLVLVLSGCRAIGSARPAALQVTATPESSVFLDGKHLGKTPFFSDQLKSGQYTLKITASEAAYVDKITLTEGTLTVVNRELANNFQAQSGETLWLEPGRRGLLVISQPTEADLTIDGTLVGKTPKQIEEIQEGEHKISLAKNGYGDRLFSIKISKKYQLVAEVTLASLAAKGVEPFPSPASLEPQKVEITQTPQGFLRVRSEPLLTAPEIGRVKTGDKLEVIQEIKDWIKVNFSDLPAGKAGKQGWISAQYTKKLP